MPYGIPKTNEERKATHKDVFGDENVPPVRKGNPGMTKEEYEKNILILSALETIRVNQFIPFNLHITQSSGNDTTSQFLYTKVFEPGFIYIITSMCGIDVTDAAHQIRLGIFDGVTPFYFESATVANIGDSVEYVGQLMCKETDKLFAEFLAIGASDEIHFFINGYKIRR